MYDFIETQFTLTEEEQKFFDYIQWGDFPFYLQEATPGIRFFGHVLMHRNLDETQPVRGIPNSPYCAYAEAIVRRFCSEQNVPIKDILRMTLNCTTYAEGEHNAVHVDHIHFEHWNFILYMNDVPGSTYIFDAQGNIVKEFEPKKNKVIVFKGQPHANKSCGSNEWRFVLVATFTKPAITE